MLPDPLAASVELVALESAALELLELELLELELLELDEELELLVLLFELVVDPMLVLVELEESVLESVFARLTVAELLPLSPRSMSIGLPPPMAKPAPPAAIAAAITPATMAPVCFFFFCVP